MHFFYPDFGIYVMVKVSKLRFWRIFVFSLFFGKRRITVHDSTATRVPSDSSVPGKLGHVNSYKLRQLQTEPNSFQQFSSAADLYLVSCPIIFISANYAVEISQTRWQFG